MSNWIIMLWWFLWDLMNINVCCFGALPAKTTDADVGEGKNKQQTCKFANVWWQRSSWGGSTSVFLWAVWNVCPTIALTPQHFLRPSQSVNLQEQKPLNQFPDCAQCNQKAATECHCGDRKSVYAETQLTQIKRICSDGKKSRAIILCLEMRVGLEFTLVMRERVQRGDTVSGLENKPCKTSL